MTNDDKPESVPEFDPTSFLARCREFDKLCDSVRPENKAALFDALVQVGITSVLVEFDGYGDSGQIENISAHAGQDVAVNLPNLNIVIARVEYGSHEIVRQTMLVKDAVEHLAYGFLEQTHSGWENNAGAYGDFHFDIAAQTITLNYNERFEDSEYTQHLF